MIMMQCFREGRALPKAIANAPVLLTGLELWFVAFNELSSCRQIGMSMGPIPWTAMSEYADRNEFVGEQREDLFRHMNALDSWFLDYHMKKAKKPGK